MDKRNEIEFVRWHYEKGASKSAYVKKEVVHIYVEKEIASPKVKEVFQLYVCNVFIKIFIGNKFRGSKLL